VADTLSLIERLAPRLVIPGHGAPFVDVTGALQRARSRLAGFVADPYRHVRHGAKVLLKYHLLEERAQAWPDLLAWWDSVPLLNRLWQRWPSHGLTMRAWCEQLVKELAAAGALRIEGSRVLDA
jgi:hypothetical protein